MVVFPLVMFFVLIGLMMVASSSLVKSGKIQKMQPIKENMQDSDDFGNIQSMDFSGDIEAKIL